MEHMIDIYFESVPEHYVAPDFSVTVNHKEITEREKADIIDAIHEAFSKIKRGREK
jgi:hypothetical protein